MENWNENIYKLYQIYYALIIKIDNVFTGCPTKHERSKITGISFMQHLFYEAILAVELYN